MILMWDYRIISVGWGRPQEVSVKSPTQAGWVMGSDQAAQGFLQSGLGNLRLKVVQPLWVTSFTVWLSS